MTARINRRNDDLQPPRVQTLHLQVIVYNSPGTLFRKIGQRKNCRQHDLDPFDCFRLADIDPLVQ